MKRINLASLMLVVALSGCGGKGNSSNPEPVPDPEPSPEPMPKPTIEDYAILSWSAPATRENGDGLAMGDLSHYVVLYGLDPEDLSNSVQVNNASVDPNQTLRIDGLASGKWFFAVKVVDTEDRESKLSDIVSKTIEI